MIALIIFATFFVANTYTFMYQRTTLTIARAIGGPVPEIKLVLTPTWMGILGWVSTFGLYGSYILIWLQIGFIWAIAVFILNHIITSILPIPSKYFYNLVKKHLANEAAGSPDIDGKESFISLLIQVKQIEKNYEVS